MASKNTSNLKYDPSNIKQHFATIDIRLHCCRYWKLDEWEFRNMSFPFWRIYYNSIAGASVLYYEREVPLNENVVLLIPPYTSFSTSLKKSKTESLNGSRIQSVDEYQNLKHLGMIDHLFVHFNLGFQYDRVKPDVYGIEISGNLKEMLDQIRFSTISDYSNFGFRQTLLLHQLITNLLDKIPLENMNTLKLDKRVLKVMEFIGENSEKKLNNEILGNIANMATNSMLRLFRNSTNTTVQQFVQNERIEKAIILMHNNKTSIDQIAETCGFRDRQHFSKVFKRIKGTSPVAYRKLHVL